MDDLERLEHNLDLGRGGRPAHEVLRPKLGDLVAQYDPDAWGGAVLLGIDGVCVIAHGSSTADSFAKAIGLAAECAEAGFVHRMKEAIAHGA